MKGRFSKFGALSSACLAFCLSPQASSDSAQTGHVNWTSWSKQSFDRARAQKKPIILDLEAVWCHWCHVMDGTTYARSEVASLINRHFIALRVDQDSRPDLAMRYQNFGWPATIIFSPNGKEIVKQAGYVPPERMIALLKSVIKEPNRVRDGADKAVKLEFGSGFALSSDSRQALLERCLDGYDTEHGGWGSGHKFLDWDTVEFCMTQVDERRSKLAGMAQATLNGEQHLVDPVWGGVYQYSTGGDWVHPHFEKIMQMQAENMRIYSLAYEFWHDPRYLQTAQEICRFLTGFLQDEAGAFYTSMDADPVAGLNSAEYFRSDNEQRLKHGLPKIDKHIYARENGWAVIGLVSLYGATGDDRILNDAKGAAAWILLHRALPGGGFSHDAKDAAGPYLDDTLAMGRAFLSLYAATGERQWFERAEQCAVFIDRHFKLIAADGRAAGLASSAVNSHDMPEPEANVDENVMIARFANLLFQYSGRRLDLNLAQTAMRFLAAPAVARGSGIYCAGILLADHELAGAPTHITVVGRKDDEQARALVMAA